MADSIPREGICAYCGTIGEVTDDHVVPQCLWPGRMPKEAPIVDACKKCNNEEKSRTDTYLRDFLTMDMANEGQPARERIYPKMMRAVQRNQSVFAHHAQRADLLGWRHLAVCLLDMHTESSFRLSRSPENSRP